MAENQNTEWKRTWQDEYLKWVCGFANADGGSLFIGKDDAGKVVGLTKAGKLLNDLPNKIRSQLGLMPDINLHTEGSKNYLEIAVSPSKVPISLRGRYYWRSGTVLQELKGQALNDFMLKKMGLTWDGVILERARLDDIDDEAIERFSRDAAQAGRLPDTSRLSTEGILRKLHLLTKDGLTNAALVLFGKDPGEYFPNLFVKIGRFGESVVDMRFQEVCEGNLIQLLTDVMEILEKKFLVKNVDFDGIHRIETLEYPVAALREMLLNALVHRNYLGSMTQIKVLNSSLNIWNAGPLPDGLTVRKLFQTHESLPRNPLIAEVCYKAGYIDSWGRGIEKITEACRQAGLGKPAIKQRTGGVAFELTKTPPKTPPKTLPKTPVKTLPKTPVKTLPKTPPKTLPKTPPKKRQKESVEIAANAKHTVNEHTATMLTNTQSDILRLLKKDNTLTLADVANQLGKSISAVKRATSKLRDLGKLEYVGPRKGGHWVIHK